MNLLISHGQNWITKCTYHEMCDRLEKSFLFFCWKIDLFVYLHSLFLPFSFAASSNFLPRVSSISSNIKKQHFFCDILLSFLCLSCANCYYLFQIFTAVVPSMIDLPLHLISLLQSMSQKEKKRKTKI